MGTYVDSATSAPASGSSITPTLPSFQAGDIGLMFIGGKYNASVTRGSNPTGWSFVTAVSGGTVTTGNDAGDSFIFLYARVMQAGDTAQAYSHGSGGNSIWSIVATYRPASGNVWTDGYSVTNIPKVNGNDTTAASPLTAGAQTFSPQPSAALGNVLVACGAAPTDLSSGAATPVLSFASGASAGTVTSRNYVENTQGADSCGAIWDHVGFTGTSTGTVTASIVMTGASNMYGPVLAIWLREALAKDGSDSLTVTDPTSTRYGQAGDLLTFTESAVAGVPAVDKSGTESVAITDAASALDKQTTDALALTDAATTRASQISESLTFSETTSLDRQVKDSLTLTDTSSTRYAGAGEVASFTESASVDAGGAEKSGTESLTFTEKAGVDRTVLESLTFTDVGSSPDKFGTEALTITDAAPTVAKQVPEALTFTESASLSGQDKLGSESIEADDYDIDLERPNEGETLTISESVIGFERQILAEFWLISEGVSLDYSVRDDTTELDDYDLDLDRPDEGESMTLTESAPQVERQILEFFTITETEQVDAGAVKTGSDSLTFTDAAGANDRQILEALTLSEAASSDRQTGDSLTFTETETLDITGATPKDGADTFTWSELAAVDRQITETLTLAEAVALDRQIPGETWSLTDAAGIARAYDEPLTFTDAAGVEQLSDQIHAAETLTFVDAAGLARPVVDSLSFTEAAHVERQVLEALTFTDLGRLVLYGTAREIDRRTATGTATSRRVPTMSGVPRG